MTRVIAAAGLTGLVVLASEPIAALGSRLSSRQALPPILAKSIAAYAALASYSDTGTADLEGASTVDRSKFTTHFRRQNGDLYYEYQALGVYYASTKSTLDMSAYRLVVWMLRGHMETYEKYSGNHSIIDGGRQATVLVVHGAGTKGTSTLITSLLYPQARMRTSILEFEEASDAGFEQVANRRCHKVTGIAAQRYPSGARTGVRPMTVWIDAETLMVRKVFEDTPKAMGTAGVHRSTVTIDPQMNPTLDDSKFQFKVPAR